MFDHPPGATALDLDEAEGLIPQHITTQDQLNEWEQENIAEVEKWVSQHHFESVEVLDVRFVKNLHQKMFCRTWRWAGKYRQSNKNIGVDWPLVAEELKVLLDDVRYHRDHQVYCIDEIAARFHHRLVSVHAFSNGNGRHARMMADIFLLSQSTKRFTWGSEKNLAESGSVREQYIDALRAADKHDYQKLMSFVRS